VVEQNLGGASGQTGNEVTQQAKQQGRQLGRQARYQADELASRGGQQVKTQLTNQKQQVAERMTPIQAALRETAQQLRKQDQASYAQYVDKASDQVERLSGYLRETDVEEMTNEVRSFARSRPVLFLGGAAILGFLSTRFLKSSSSGSGAGYGAYGDREPVAALPPADDVYGEAFPETGRPPTGEPVGRVGAVEAPKVSRRGRAK
jgi:F0F1-type ATP synthase membrane subunit b/b'